VGWTALGVVIAVLTHSAIARAIPAFARKYGTSCQTCHTVYPKLTPFGEAFRRNGYRFPGIDTDMVKQETVPLGQEAYKQQFPHAVWPAIIPNSVPIAVGFNGQAVFHPDTKSGGGAADNGSGFTLGSLVEEAHIWAGGSFDEKTTFFGELTFSSDGVEIEHAKVLFNDLLGPKHAVNLMIGKTMSTLSSFGPHSSYVSDLGITPLSVTALYGATSDSWNTAGTYNGAEVTGVVVGRFNYSIGLNAGANVDVRPTENVYGHVGYKIGGMRLDGEGSSGAADPTRPWAERALTFDAFLYRSASHYTNGAMPPAAADDEAVTFGGGLRAQWDSLEFNSGIYQERHDHALADGTGVHALAQYNELSYIVFPWLVPAVRIEYIRLTPSGQSSVDDLRIIPGVAALVRPNLKLTLVGQIEVASGAPDAGWGAAGGLAAPAMGADVTEIESVQLGLAFAF
jgi:hypothetical protein